MIAVTSSNVLCVDVSGVVFDTHSKVVMSQGGTFEKMKEKVRTRSISESLFL